MSESFHQLAALIVYACSIKIPFSLKNHVLGWHQLLNASNNSVLFFSFVLAKETAGSFHAKQPSIIPAFPKEVTKGLESLANLS